MTTVSVFRCGIAAFITSLSLLILGGCAGLPRIVPDMAPRAPQPIEGAHGPLSAERSRQILDRLKASSESAGILARHLALEQAVSDSPLVAGNTVKLLENGPATYKAMLSAIAAARDHVNMETYILEDDEAGKQFAEALLAKQAEGVQVNLIHDSVGTIGTPKEFFTRLSDAGIKVLEFNPVNPLNAKVGWDVNQRDHRKLLVVDGRVAFLGGINISSVYSGGSFSRQIAGSGAKPAGTDDGIPWRDTDLQIEGPVVAEFQKLFLETWQKQQGDPLPQRDYYPTLNRVGSEVVHAIGGSPDEPFSQIYATFISAIENAESEILITNAYFVPDPQLLEALCNAAKRGVVVRLVLPGRSDSELVLNTGRSYYEDLLQAGVKIYERHEALLHSKTALIDGVWVTIGSTNLDWRSFLHNQEINAVVLGSGFAGRLRASFEDDVSHSEEITLEQWHERPLGQRVKEQFGRLWQYWL